MTFTMVIFFEKIFGLSFKQRFGFKTFHATIFPSTWWPRRIRSLVVMCFFLPPLITQEEIKFAQCPELLAAVIFMQSMDDNEAVLMSNYRCFSRCAGLGTGFRFQGPLAQAQLWSEVSRCFISLPIPTSLTSSIVFAFLPSLSLSPHQFPYFLPSPTFSSLCLEIKRNCHFIPFIEKSNISVKTARN